ncbi:MAG TPA: hypothetical protein VGQ30_11140 [Gemmatimonadaceae bacterium]|jgi:hypothetical protein|nr:hypothetical protein [Gemmatimonadaceae bacterium]
MINTNEWSAWEESWRAARTSSEEIEELIARTGRARRSIVLMRVVSGGLAVVSLAIVGAALRHAGNPFEASLGLIVGLGVAAVWLFDARIQLRAAESVAAPQEEYFATRRRLCIRRLRFVRLGWIVVALDLAFLIPWWIGGLRVHGSAFNAGQLLTIWTPVAAMAVFLAWTVTVRSRARAELARLDGLASRATQH